MPSDSRSPTPSSGTAERDEPPLLSILIPVFNGAATLSTALESIIDQADLGVVHEVLISDDASTDGSVAVAESFLPRLPNARLFRRAHNLGGPGNWQFLLEQAHGDFVFLLPQDDALGPNGLATFRAALRRHPDTDMLIGSLELRDADFVPMEDLPLPTPDGVTDGVTRVREQLASHHMVMSTFYRRRALLDVGGWDASVGSHVDCTAFCRVALRAPVTMYVDACLLRFRFSPSSWTSRVASAHRSRAEWYRRKLDLLRDDAARLHPDLVPFITGMYRRHAEIALGGLEIALATGTASGSEVRAAVHALLSVFPEARRSRMAVKVGIASVIGTWWLRGLRRLLGRPDPYRSPLTRMLQSTAAPAESR